VAELVDALDSKSSSARSAGSIPARGTSLRCFAASAWRAVAAGCAASLSIFKTLQTWLRRHGFAISRRQAPESCLNFPPPIAEGVGNAGCPVHPQPRTRILVVSMRTSIHSEVTGIIRHSPRNGFTAYNELSPVIGFLATVISGLRFCPSPVGPEKTSADLTPAPRRQDHTLLPYAARLCQRLRRTRYRSDKLWRRRKAPFVLRAGNRSRMINPPCDPVARPTLPRPPHPAPRP
jgi:hypothetical protein